MLRLSSGLMVIVALHGLSACGDTEGGGGDGDGDSSSGGHPSSGGSTSDGGSPSIGGSPTTGGASPAGGTGGRSSGGMNQGGEGGMGGASEGMGGESNDGTGGLPLTNCPSKLPSGDCELGDSFSCQGWIYPFVTPFCVCSETEGYEDPQWSCAL